MEREALGGPAPDAGQAAELGDEALQGRGVHGAGPEYAAQRAAHAFWAQQDLSGIYATRELRPVEVMLLVRHREALTGRVLEVGCGAGRLGGYLAALASEYTGTDIAPPMVAASARRYPRGRFRVADLRDLSGGPWDAIVAAFNVVDVLDPAARDAWLGAARTALAPGGRLLFSTHNLDAAATITDPWRLRWRGPLRTTADVLRLPRRARNRLRARRHERRGDGWALLNDEGHEFRVLNHYTTRAAQERALAAHGFAVEEVADLDGRPLGPGDTAPGCPELHYVARAA